ncbi:hypothetical protein CSB45_14605 [candidate division KSB3 bacterium]|uniref:Uncharacterized protein n=1 Tax=candidate division KSB3 bacterium TaxID=2044937 RepID=A0A2G6E1I5_9BACT|nr:MAG: hypothetical protein CSB45_14605 [candidate division KSB3 bacterium]PIE28432.1 MAG: hypothetical protein CSA57_14045 [candidate division KSB3 bacterium]
MSGFITPDKPVESDSNIDLGLVQAQIFMPNGKIMDFWFGVLTPTKEMISDFYKELDKSHQDVFPMRFEVIENLSTGISSGSIHGFCSSGENDEIKLHL